MSTPKKNSLSTAQKIGRYLKYQREKKGLSLNDFSKLADLTPSFLFRLEKGEYKSVKFDVVEKLAGALNMSLLDLLCKCEIIDKREDLPQLEFYLKEKYQFPPEAIADFKLFINFLKEKYKKKIKKYKSKHKQYWQKK